MEDRQIVALFFARSERAVTAAQEKYGRYCYTVAYNILGSHEDARECENDVYLRAWNAIPPQRPASLGAYLAKIARNLALNRVKHDHAQKRGQGQTTQVLAELSDLAAPSAEPNMGELTASIGAFLRGQKPEKRRIFLRRYFALAPVAQIAQEMGMSESKVTSLLFRMRRELKAWLAKEGLYDE